MLDYIHQQRLQAEVIVVNDGSTDDTADVVREFAATNPEIRLLENPGNRGKGYSVRNGMLHAQGDVLLFTDADLSSPIYEAEKLFDAIAQGADIAIGSRWLQAELQTERQPWYRQLYGRLFNLGLRIVLGLTLSRHTMWLQGIYPGCGAIPFFRGSMSSAGASIPSCCFWPTSSSCAPSRSRWNGPMIIAPGSIRCATASTWAWRC